ncbi:MULTISPECIES: CoA pyrophosphatase [unclassified Yoonia]|uniref:CoA pyrophosphatase n=1 Tax=unclassified Yoonia TaxID=2629118 RepID=UPI002AFF1A9F|nr:MULTISPECIES: CoA pyrophosphatase [unclassified Yoonia]
MPDLHQRLMNALSVPGGASTDYDLNKDITVPPGPLTPAAVLFAVREDSETVILTKRSARLKHHPGQIAFPGGKQDPIDATLTDAALREAREEIGLPPEQVDVLGVLPSHQTVTGYLITPVLAMVRGPFTPIPEAGEVSEVFEVPLAHLSDPALYRIEGRYWQGRKRLYYTVPFGPYYIWGATARILRAFADRVS